MLSFILTLLISTDQQLLQKICIISLYLQLLYVAVECQYRTIWVDAFISTSSQWSCSGLLAPWTNIDDVPSGDWTKYTCYMPFTDGGDECDSDPCLMMCSRGGTGGWLERTTTITSYSALQFQFYAGAFNLEIGNQCQVWYKYNTGSWTNAWETSGLIIFDRYTDQLVNLGSTGTATTVTIKLQINGDSSACNDICYYDSLALFGIPKPTPAPTNIPTNIPTRYPTYIPTNPTIIPTTYPTKIPSKTPTTTPTIIPTFAPSTPPPKSPTSAPTDIPSASPTITTLYPSQSPTVKPTTSQQSIEPTTDDPTKAPTKTPTEAAGQVGGETTENFDRNDDKIIVSQNDSNINAAVIVGIIVAAIIVIAVMFLLCIYFRKTSIHKRTKQMTIAQSVPPKSPNSNVTGEKFLELDQFSTNNDDDDIMQTVNQMMSTPMGVVVDDEFVVNDDAIETQGGVIDEIINQDEEDDDDILEGITKTPMGLDKDEFIVGDDVEENQEMELTPMANNGTQGNIEI